MNGIIAGLSGASSAASNTGGYYQDALNREITAAGSPAAQQFAQEESNALQPQFKQQDAQLAAKLAAMGITHSGAAKNDFSNLASEQSATLAGNEAPLWAQALGQYGQINAAEPGAQSSAYQQAINNFYQGMSDATLGLLKPPSGGATSPDFNPYGTAAPIYAGPQP